MKTNPTNANVPYGYCACECGEKTQIAKQSRHDRKWINGEPKHYVKGHQGRNRKGRPFHEQYEVNEITGCWLWRGGSRGWDGYGCYLNPETKRSMQAHRFSYIEAKGEIPVGLVLDHRCSTPACVNPDHLEAVTQAVNVQRGKLARLTPEQVGWIKGSKLSWRTLAVKYDVGKSTIQSIKNGSTWQNIAATTPPDEDD